MLKRNNNDNNNNDNGTTTTTTTTATDQLHPVCCLRFVSDWTQPLDILLADSELVCYFR